jgi:hypothetical protein
MVWLQLNWFSDSILDLNVKSSKTTTAGKPGAWQQHVVVKSQLLSVIFYRGQKAEKYISYFQLRRVLNQDLDFNQTFATIIWHPFRRPRLCCLHFSYFCVFTDYLLWILWNMGSIYFSIFVLYQYLKKYSTGLDCRTRETGLRQDSDRTPTGLRQDSERTPKGLRQDSDRTPTGLRQDSDRTLTGLRQDSDRTPTGLRQDSDRTPTGLRQDSERTATGLRQDSKGLQRQKIS